MASRMWMEPPDCETEQLEKLFECDFVANLSNIHKLT